MRPHFDYYIGSLDRWPFHCGVNLSLKDAAPLEGLVWRAHVRIDLNHPTADGLATNDEEAELYNVEEQILARLAGDEHCFVSQVTHRNRRTMVIYLKTEAKEGHPLVQGIASVTTHKAAMIECVNDPDWSEYLEFLYPQPNFEHQIRDRKTLKVMEERGDDCSRLHNITAEFWASDPAIAEKLAAEMKQLGFPVASIVKAEGADKGGWRITGIVKSPLAIAIIDDFREKWLALAESTGARYDGWRAEIVPVESDGKKRKKGRAKKAKAKKAAVAPKPAAARRTAGKRNARSPKLKKVAKKVAKTRGPKKKATAVARRKATKAKTGSRKTARASKKR